ncbi:MAG: Shedu immune nuclease family protein [Saprospiraceae bacterium]
MENNEIELNYINNGSADKTYFTRSFENVFTKKTERFGHKILDFNNDEFILSKEAKIGVSYNGRRMLKAQFYENDRKIKKLFLQQFDSSEVPVKNKVKEASFNDIEIERLYLFLKAIKEVDFIDNFTFNVKDEDLKKMLLDSNQTKKLVNDNFELIQSALKNNVTPYDLINYGFRRGQLEIFEKLLYEKNYINDYKNELILSNELKENSGEESVWQKYFEKNTWILGYGLEYLFNTELDGKKLEQVTSGANFNNSGKRIDGLLKSQGVINSLCFCELKLSTDSLLKQVKNSYRPEAWQISDSLSGAIAQVQRTIQKALFDIKEKEEIRDEQSNLTGEELYMYNPKGFILIGNQNEFITDGKINPIKYSSFEMYRKNLKNIEILTYDELYHRAKYICDK